MEQSRLSTVVRGRVQGVGFRYYTRDIARSLGLTGWVRNREDGSVEMEAQGDPRDLEMLCDQVREGPSVSYVSNVVITSIPAVEHEDSFTIRH